MVSVGQRSGHGLFGCSALGSYLKTTIVMSAGVAMSFQGSAGEQFVLKVLWLLTGFSSLQSIGPKALVS
jgi:hypothetical protein